MYTYFYSVVNVLKFRILYSMLSWSNFVLKQLFLKILSGMANRVDPDRLILGYLPYNITSTNYLQFMDHFYSLIL